MKIDSFAWFSEQFFKFVILDSDLISMTHSIIHCINIIPKGSKTLHLKLIIRPTLKAGMTQPSSLRGTSRPSRSAFVETSR